MAQKVLIMGESGTGKSTSMRNCDPAITAVVNPVGKPLPFKNHFETLDNGFRPLSGSYISQYHPRNPMFCLGQIGGLRGKSNFIEMQPFWKVKNSHKSSI